MLPFNQITIVIVAYHGDFAMLERCLESINKFCKIEQIKSIKLILNDTITYIKALFNKSLIIVAELLSDFVPKKIKITS